MRGTREARVACARLRCEMRYNDPIHTSLHGDRSDDSDSRPSPAKGAGQDAGGEILLACLHPSDRVPQRVATGPRTPAGSPPPLAALATNCQRLRLQLLLCPHAIRLFASPPARRIRGTSHCPLRPPRPTARTESARHPSGPPSCSARSDGPRLCCTQHPVTFPAPEHAKSAASPRCTLQSSDARLRAPNGPLRAARVNGPIPR